MEEMNNQIEQYRLKLIQLSDIENNKTKNLSQENQATLIQEKQFGKFLFEKLPSLLEEFNFRTNEEYQKLFLSYYNRIFWSDDDGKNERKIEICKSSGKQNLSLVWFRTV